MDSDLLTARDGSIRARGQVQDGEQNVDRSDPSGGQDTSVATIERLRISGDHPPTRSAGEDQFSRGDQVALGFATDIIHSALPSGPPLSYARFRSRSGSPSPERSPENQGSKQGRDSAVSQPDIKSTPAQEPARTAISPSPIQSQSKSSLGPKLAALMSSGTTHDNPAVLYGMDRTKAPLSYEPSRSSTMFPPPTTVISGFATAAGGGAAARTPGHTSSVSLGGVSFSGLGSHPMARVDRPQSDGIRHPLSMSFDSGRWAMQQAMGLNANQPDVMSGIVHTLKDGETRAGPRGHVKLAPDFQTNHSGSLDSARPRSDRYGAAYRRAGSDSSSYSPPQANEDLHTHRPLPHSSDMHVYPAIGTGRTSAYTYHPYSALQAYQGRPLFSESESTSPTYPHGASPSRTIPSGRRMTDASISLSNSPPTSSGSGFDSRFSSGFGPMRTRSPGSGGHAAPGSLGCPPSPTEQLAGMTTDYPFPSRAAIGSEAYRSLPKSRDLGEIDVRRPSDALDRRGLPRETIDVGKHRGYTGEASGMMGVSTAGLSVRDASRPVRSAQDVRLEAKQARIESEQRRRDEIREGFKVLKQCLPLSNQRSSKVVLIDRAVERIHLLERGHAELLLENQHLLAENERLARSNQQLVEAQTMHITRAAHGVSQSGVPRDQRDLYDM